MDEEGRITEVVMEFPMEIVIEILLRLPVKSLLRFKTACKSWYSIISSTDFIKKHLHLAHAARYNQHKTFVCLRVPYVESATYPCVLYSEDSDGVVCAREFVFPDKRFVVHDDDIRLCNSCNGLICYVITWDSLLIWNPSLPSEYKIIQAPWDRDYEPTALVYDAPSDDYKIVKLPVCGYRNQDFLCFSIFSFKSNSWRSKRISIKESINHYTYRFVYAKNRLYWIATEGEETEYIVYFNLAEESLDYINLPAINHIRPRLINFKESIAIVRENFEDQRELWVLEDHCGMKSSWKKIFSSNVIPPVLPFRYPCFTLNGDILAHTEELQLNRYNRIEGGWEHVEFLGNNDEDCYLELVSPYVESLVSPRQL
ncbi:F-box family protein [Euphorbia peplus]|nr:F-box family protein [Euphorbia peplus]